MRRIRKGWQQFGVDDPWWVVHSPRRQWIPRFHSEPDLLRKVNGPEGCESEGAR